MKKIIIFADTARSTLKQKSMKKFTITLIAIGFIFSAISCKTHEKCPAYGKADTKTEKRV
jgi:hypothetical protein